MASYEVAHIKEQGIDLIIIVVDSSFGFKTLEEQQEITAALQECATAAGLAGTVVPGRRGSGKGAQVSSIADGAPPA